ncbi:MAG TPA: ABC transporter substrate-binding protein, partial [Aggregatilineales bacterium]|nr:ABC transporter substrate-binding protein [Aggregatilineales bacterium]
NASPELGIPLMSVYDTLVYRHPQTLVFESGLAESWEISPDRKAYTFKLRQGVTFHDGETFNANAVGVNFDRIVAAETASQKARGLLGPFYQGYSIIDEYTFQIQLNAPYEPLLDALSQVYLGIASPLALANYNDGTYQWHQVGTGPYKMVEAVPGDRIVLERNPDYNWGPAFYTQENPNPVQVIEFRFFVDAATRDDALQSGQVQLVGELLPVDAELLLGNSQLRIYPVAIPGQPLQFLFNLNRFPTGDLTVRQALIQATNRTAIVDSIFAGQSPVAYGALSSATEFYHPGVEEFYPYDPTAADNTFQQANIRDTNQDGILDSDGIPLQITILAPPWGLIPEVSQAIAGQWRSIGIEVKIEQVPTFGQLLDKIAEGDYNLVALYSFGLDASILNSYYLSDGLDNVTHYSSVELDTLLTQALQESDATTRANLYAAAQTMIMEQALLLPIRDYMNLNGSSDDLEGVIFDAHGWWPLLNNFQWAG